MKKVNLKGKLSLKKEIIAKLNDKEMNAVKGGGVKVTAVQSNCNCSYVKGCATIADPDCETTT